MAVRRCSIRRLLTGLCRTWVCLPFTAGHRVTGHDRRSLDGKIATIVTLASLVAPSIVVMVVSSSHVELYRHSNDLIRAILSLFTFLGVISVTLFFTPYLRKGVWSLKSVSDASKGANAISNVRHFFLLFFAMGFCSQHIFKLAFDVLSKESSQLDILNKVIALLFCIGQSIFLCVHKRRIIHIRSELKIRYGMVLIIAADVSIWFHTILNESQDQYRHDLSKRSCAVDSMYKKCTNGSNVNCPENQNDVSCALAKMIETTDLVLFPMVIEFTLLSVGLLLKLWSHTVAKERLDSSSLPSDVESTSPKAGFFHLDQEPKSGLNAFPEKTNPLHSLLTTVGVFIAVFLLVFKYIVYTLNEVSMYVHYEEVQSVYIITLLVLNIVAFYYSATVYEVKVAAKPIKVREYLIVFCCFGTIFYLTFTVIAGAMSWNKPGGVVIMIEFIVDCLSVYFQTTLMLLSTRLVQRPGSRSTALQNVFILISSINLALWTVDGFITSTNPDSSRIQSEFYMEKYWYDIVKVVFPVTIYFRFHSFVEFMELSFKV